MTKIKKAWKLWLHGMMLILIIHYLNEGSDWISKLIGKEFLLITAFSMAVIILCPLLIGSMARDFGKAIINEEEKDKLPNQSQKEIM